MKQSTARFLERYGKTGDLRGAISDQVKESRFYFYAQGIKNNTQIKELVNAGCVKTLSAYIAKNQQSLNIPVRLTNRGVDRMASYLMLQSQQQKEE